MDGSVRKECQDMEECKEVMVYMWGYIPEASPEKSPILSPVPDRLPEGGVEAWKDVCVGGCGFLMAISETGKLITWGSANDEVQSYLTSGKHGETPEPFPLPSEAAVVKAAAGWAHCVSVIVTLLLPELWNLDIEKKIIFNIHCEGEGKQLDIGSLCNCILPEALKATTVCHDPNFQGCGNEKKKLRSTFSCLSSISMHQREVSMSSLFLHSHYKGCLPPWELKRSRTGSRKEH